ncbi:SGNH/GDSL hydrolase family protein [Nocardiopsis suaedae]|uniref:SGNH/GDSL hydrolase family protein n=1 Tax=Nocardiopsis suaedae TaxID=3018444 RepID=A0ABT4TF88_9ACTN|nr:SGNH/GDSL hydrolase family protein [Nocardiopsis suaedae]MDA2803090.1 SGNH/GDSL hydrolase family protein [Nocardiopsis suaedae]
MPATSPRPSTDTPPPGRARTRRPGRGGGLLLAAALPLAVLGGATAPPPSAEAAPAPPLAELYDNRGISDDADPGAADLDGQGRSLSAQALRRAGWGPGQELTLHGTRLTLPDTRPGEPDNVVADGQSVPLRGKAEAVTLLAAATGGGAEGEGRIVYADGTRHDYTATAPDWETGPLTTKAVELDHANTADGTVGAPVRLYAVTVPVDRDRPLARIELPTVSGGARMHVFDVAARPVERGWTGTWSASTSGYAAVGPWEDQTLRLIVRSSTGGPGARIRLDNTFAARPVDIGAVSVALQGEGAAADGAPVPVTFGGERSTTLPAGGQASSDPIAFDVPAGARLAVSVHLPGRVEAAPVHTANTGDNYAAEPGSGDLTGTASGAPFTRRIDSWPFLTGVDVPGNTGSVVALGDSITDGVGTTPGTDRRWPDVLSDRLRDQRGVPRYGVLNQGISANRVVTDRYGGDGVSSDTGGVAAVNRLDRDVFAQTGARTVIVFQGVNDVRAGTAPEELADGLEEVAERARSHGLRVVAATIAPCKGWSDCTEEVDRDRRRVNAFIREGAGEDGPFDAVLDFDAVLRDPADPARLLPEYDSGDHLHPGDAGLRAVAESIDLAVLGGRGPDRA